MIDKDLETVKKIVEKNGGWKEAEAFDRVVNCCEFVGTNFKSKNEYLIKFVAWYIANDFEINARKVEHFNDFYIKNFILSELSLIMNTPLDLTLDSLANAVNLARYQSDYTLIDNKEIKETFQGIINSFIAKQTQK
jgi:hypothetical protein